LLVTGEIPCKVPLEDGSLLDVSPMSFAWAAFGLKKEQTLKFQYKNLILWQCVEIPIKMPYFGEGLSNPSRNPTRAGLHIRHIRQLIKINCE
jgi:hypothetical protein